jgi:hypothetical protein
MADLQANSSNDTLFADDKGKIALLLPQFSRSGKGAGQPDYRLRFASWEAKTFFLNEAAATRCCCSLVKIAITNGFTSGLRGVTETTSTSE